MKIKSSLKHLLVCMFFFLITAGTYAGNPDTDPCNNASRYTDEKNTGATRLDSATAATLIDEFRKSNPGTEDNPTGFIFTKKMFDEIFQDPAINSVSLDLVRYENKLTLVVKGHVTQSTRIDGTTGNRIFMVRSYCPTDCDR